MTQETATRISELEAENDRLRDTLEAARPLLKRLALEGSAESDRVLGEIEEALQ